MTTVMRATSGARRWDNERGCYVYDISFKRQTPVTERTVQVAEAFGLGVDEEHEFTLYDDFEIYLNDRDVVYITGDSGSGKSVLLRAIHKDLEEEAAIMNELPEPAELPLIDTLGSSFKEALALLSMVGLNDAVLFLRSYSELSEGQRYRYKLAQLMESGKNYWLCDEFCSTLDRTTAKIVAYNVQKQARRTGTTLIVATTHNDLQDDLNPNIVIRKGWEDEISIKYRTNLKKKFCTVSREVQIVEASKDAYDQLSFLHYRGSRVTGPWKYYKMVRRGELVGVIVYTYPSIGGAVRKQTVGYSPSIDELNRDWALISRVIIYPKYRGIGLGTRLIMETLPLQGRKHVELVAVMAQYNPFAERAGMRLISVRGPHKSIDTCIEKLKALGLDPSFMGSLSYNKKFLDSLEDINPVLGCLSSITVGHYFKRLARQGKPYVRKEEFLTWLSKQDNESLAKTLQTLNVLGQTKAYLYWCSDWEGKDHE